MAESITLGILLRFKDEASKGVQAALGGISALGKEADATHKRVIDLERGFRSLRDTGLGLSAMGAAAGAALVSVIQPAAQLQEQITNALTLTGETGDAFARMERGMTESAVRLSTKLGISADQVAEGFYQVLSTGAQAMTPEFEALSETALKMAKTVGLAPADAVEVLSDSVNQFGLELTQASRVADVFFTASKLSTLTVPQLVDSMREAGAAASSVGISLEETAAVLSGFASKGVKGAKAGTAFRMILTRLAKPPEEAARALQFLGVSVFDAQGEMRPLVPILKDMKKGMAGLTGAQKAAVLKAIAGEEAFSKLGGLLDGNLDTIESWKKELEASGALQVAFTQKMSSASEQVRVLWISFKNLATAIGQPLLGPLTGIAGALAGVIQKLEGFAKAHPVLGKLAGGALALVAVLGILAGGILTLTGALGLFALKWLPLARTGMGLFSKGLMRALPLITGWTQAAFSGARAALAWTAATVKDLAARAAHLASIAAGTVATWAGAAASKAAAAAQWLWNAAMTANPIGLVIAGVAALVAGVALLVSNWEAVTGAVTDAFAWMRDLFGKAPDWVLALVFPLRLLVRHFDKVKETAILVFDAIASAVSGAFEAVRSVVGSVFDWIMEKLAFVTDKVGAVLGFVRDVGGFLGIAAAPAEAGGGRAGGQRVVPATASPMERAGARPSPTRAQEALLPPMALAGAGGSSDHSVTIQSGAVQIHAVKVDEKVVRQIDFELARLIQRRQERR